MEEIRIIKKVGAYSTSQAEPEDCGRCHDAMFGTVIIDGLCLDCFVAKTIDGNIIKQFEAMAIESLDPETFAKFEIVKSVLIETRHIPDEQTERCVRCKCDLDGEWCDVTDTTFGKTGKYCPECFAFFSAELAVHALPAEEEGGAAQ